MLKLSESNYLMFIPENLWLQFNGDLHKVYFYISHVTKFAQHPCV